MVKIHTRIKRKFGLTTSHKMSFTKNEKINCPKTFSTKESANAWAEKHGVKHFDLVPAKKNKRFKVVEK